MCGINGKLSWKNPPTRSLIDRMNGRVVHRGPDAAGIYLNGPIGLGHRRLSVIDLRNKANQPLSDSSGKFQIVFNGEIYNFKSLRQELEQSGAIFTTDSDTSVILESYKKWGTKCLEKFNGMFAFALCDDQRQSLFLARDRLGEKPLYYRLLDDGVIFASEIKSLREDPDTADYLNLNAVNQFFSLGYILSSESILEGVEKLRPANYLLVQKDKRPQVACYWNLANYFNKKNQNINENEAIKEFSNLLSDSIKLRMTSDVPLGAFLSGGIDSSTIVSIMGQIRPPKKNLTFSISFKEKSFDEGYLASKVSKLLEAPHHVECYSNTTRDELSKISYFSDEPFADTSIIPMYQLGRLAKRYTTVCLSGDGADENLAGYETYTADKICYLTRFLPAWGIRSVGGLLAKLLPVSFKKVSNDYMFRKFFEGYSSDIFEAHCSWRSIFSDEEKKNLLLPDFYHQMSQNKLLNEFSKFKDDVQGCNYLDQALYADIKTWLVDDILVKIDRSTMAHGLEARTPFLDHRLVEFCASLPIDLKMKRFSKKYLLRASQKKRLPDFILSQKKRGFNAPVSHWFRAKGGEIFEELVNGKNDIVDSILNKNYLKYLYKEHKNKHQDNGLKLFSIIMFYMWNENFKVSLK